MAEFINDSMETTQDLEGMGYEVLDGDRGDAYPKEKDLNSNGYCLFLSAKNVTKLGFSFGSCQYISREKDSEMRKGRLERGDIVITTRGTLGNVAYFTDSIPIRAMRINSGMAIIRPKTRRNPEKGEFLHSCLLSDFVQNQIAKASFGTAQNQLTLGIIKKLRFPVLSITNETLFTKQYTALLSYDKKFREGFAKREYLRQAIASDLLSGRKRVTV
jgi:type I restriction enzyme S subunit